MVSGNDIPADLWEECPGCHQLLYVKDLESQLWVCEKCGHHFRLTVWQRLEITADPGSFQEWNKDVLTRDPLEFPDYMPKVEQARRRTGMGEAVITGQASIEGHAVGLGLMDLSFIGGSMGWAVGEKITRLMEGCIAGRLPAIIFCATGGARMQESLVSLMQMPKTSGAAAKLAEAGLPYIAVITDPTYGGVTASFAMLGDVNIAEPEAAMGFAGPRVIEVTKVNVRAGVQTAEFQYQHGMLDMTVPRKQMREKLAGLLKWMTA